MELPEGFIARISNQLPLEAAQLLQALKNNSPTSIRINPFKKFPLSEGGIDKRVPWCEDGYYLNERIKFIGDPAWHAGAYYVQESSSMFLNHVLEHLPDLKREGLWLDLCAAPGGKSSLLLKHLDARTGLLVCNEVSSKRIGTLVENIMRNGNANTLITQNSAAELGQHHEQFDCILVDAPCSGEGMFRKHPEASNQWSPELLHNCELTQSSILTDIIPALKPKGYLIYSTCTFNPGENEKQLKFLLDSGLFDLVPIPINKEWKISQREPGGFAFLPHLTPGEGLFMAALQKRSSQADKRPHKAQKKRKPFQPNIEPLNMLEHGEYAYTERGEWWFAMPEPASVHANKLPHLNVRSWGTGLGKSVKKGIIPHPTLAHSLSFAQTNFNTIPLADDDAILFLSGHSLSISAPKGWTVCSWNDLPLGWAKSIGNRLNNHYPAPWRIQNQKITFNSVMR